MHLTPSQTLALNLLVWKKLVDTRLEPYLADLPEGFNGYVRIEGARGQEGPQGDDGPQGTRGFMGRIGPKGSQGDRGDQGYRGSLGEEGPSGEDGLTPSISDLETKLQNQFQRLYNEMLRNVTRQLGSGAGSGSYSILDQSDVEPKDGALLANNDVLVWDPDIGASGKFRSINLITVINNISKQLELDTMKFTKLIDAVGLLSYIGEADPGTANTAAEWRISRFDETADPDLAITWANGTNEFDKVWDDRLTFTYS